MLTRTEKEKLVWHYAFGGTGCYAEEVIRNSPQEHQSRLWEKTLDGYLSGGWVNKAKALVMTYVEPMRALDIFKKHRVWLESDVFLKPSQRGLFNSSNGQRGFTSTDNDASHSPRSKR